MKRIKYTVLLAAVVFAAFAFVGRNSTETSAQTLPHGNDTAAGTLPDRSLIDRFDRAVQQRFLTHPNFGIRRMAPTKPEPLQSTHIGTHFLPGNPEEGEILSALGSEGWVTGLYLYGKSATPRPNEKEPLGKFDIRYRVNQPLPVQIDMKPGELPGSESLIDEVKEAFMMFQSGSVDEASEFRFVRDNWSFVARPVRAVNESCVSCHTDYVVTAKFEGGKYQFRKRQVGDVNGVIVYAFSKNKD